jgi:hypothetical protein
MFRAIRRFFRRLTCRRHRWRPDRRRERMEFCDLCGAKRQAPEPRGRTKHKVSRTA